MKIVLWLATMIVFVDTLIVRTFLYIAQDVTLSFYVLQGVRVNGPGSDLPPVTAWLFTYRQLTIFLALPFLLVCILLHCRKKTTPTAVAIFTMSALLFVVAFTGYAVAVALLPLPEFIALRRLGDTIPW